LAGEIVRVFPVATSTIAIRCSSIFSSTTPESGLYATSAPGSWVEPSTNRKAIERPSGDHRGSETWPETLVSFRASPPAKEMT
jgi:hypothetical protein